MQVESSRRARIREDRQKLSDACRHLMQRRVLESEIAARLVDVLTPYFTVETEVRSTCATGRIDVLLFHHTDKGHRYPFGIEVKRLEKKQGHDLGAWLLQAMRYRQLSWVTHTAGRVGPILPLTFPQVSGLYLDEGVMVSQHELLPPGAMSGAHSNVSTFLGAMGIGEVQFFERRRRQRGSGRFGLRFVYNGKCLWAEDRERRSALNRRGNALNTEALDVLFRA